MTILSSGQITIIDLYDAPSLNAWISTSRGDSQLYDNSIGKWNPSYNEEGQNLLLHLTKAGATESLIGKGNVREVVWTKMIGDNTINITSKSTSDNEFVNGSEDSILTTKLDIPTDTSTIVYSVMGLWEDPDTEQVVSFNAKITLSLIQLAKSAIIIDTRTPGGYFFKNETPSSLTIEAYLYKNGTISNDSKLVKWFMKDTSVNSITNPNYDREAGLGWAKITATSGNTGVKSNIIFNGSVTDTTPILTVYPDAVTNGQTFQIILRDSTGVSDTVLQDFVTLMDYDDPIQVIIDSTGGSTLKNGQGSTSLTAMLFRNGQEIDEYNSTGNYSYNYTWVKYENNTLITGWNRSGKRITINNGDVNTKSVFKVEVTSK